MDAKPAQPYAFYINYFIYIFAFAEDMVALARTILCSLGEEPTTKMVSNKKIPQKAVMIQWKDENCNEFIFKNTRVPEFITRCQW